jgi:hypothetical protein
MRTTIEKKEVYVTMTDKFMSGWGHAENKTNKLVIGCDNWEEARIVQENAENRSEMRYVNIRTSKPYFRKHIVVSYHDKSDYESWFIKGYFS